MQYFQKHRHFSNTLNKDNNRFPAVVKDSIYLQSEDPPEDCQGFQCKLSKHNYHILLYHKFALLLYSYTPSQSEVQDSKHQQSVRYLDNLSNTYNCPTLQYSKNKRLYHGSFRRQPDSMGRIHRLSRERLIPRLLCMQNQIILLYRGHFLEYCNYRLEVYWMDQKYPLLTDRIVVMSHMHDYRQQLHQTGLLEDYNHLFPQVRQDSRYLKNAGSRQHLLRKSLHFQSTVSVMKQFPPSHTIPL